MYNCDNVALEVRTKKVDLTSFSKILLEEKILERDKPGDKPGTFKSTEHRPHGYFAFFFN